MQGILVYQSDSTCKDCAKRVEVKGSPKMGKWDLLTDEQKPPYSVRYGTYVGWWDISINIMNCMLNNSYVGGKAVL